MVNMFLIFLRGSLKPHPECWMVKASPELHDRGEGEVLVSRYWGVLA